MSDTFGQRLARWREAAGLNQDELARRVGVTATYIGYLEREDDPTGIGDRMRPMIQVVDAIAEALGVPLAEVRCAAGHKAPEGSPVSCEVVRNTFGEGDFAALRRMYEELTPDNRRAFHPILEMVGRELELLLTRQAGEPEGRTPDIRRRPVLERRLPRRAVNTGATSGKLKRDGHHRPPD